MPLSRSCSSGTVISCSTSWADNPRAARYRPSSAYAYTPDGPPSVQRTGTGRYVVALNGLIGNVQATAYGAAGAYCSPLRWMVGLVDVACFAPGGAPVDTRFTVLAVRDAPTAPDLTVAFEGVSGELVAGQRLGVGARLLARNRGSGPAPGSSPGRSGYIIDIVLSTDAAVPEGLSTYNALFREDVLLAEGRVSHTTDLAPSGTARYSIQNNVIPASTPPGAYRVCARIDPGRIFREIDETNNLACARVWIVRPDEVSARPQAHVQTKLAASPAGLMVDARGRQLLFPLTQSPLQFRNLEELAWFAATRLGAADARVTPRAGGDSLAFSYRSKQYSSSYWQDPVRRLSYSVVDPVLAVLGGTTGKLYIGTTSFCIDPDGICDRLPSYLVPLVTPTALSHVDQCGVDVCTQYHSFYNKVDLGFLRYARHGANTRVTSGSSGGSWRLVPCSETGAVAAPDEVVDAIRVTLRTGGDDLRGNSHIFLQLGIPGSVSFEQSLNNGAGWGGGSVNTVTVPLPSRPTASQIAWFGLRFHSGDCLACDTDNWNLDQLSVELLTAAGPRAFLGRVGAPFLRFSGALDHWSLDTTVTGGAMLCAARFPGLRLEVEASNLVQFFNEPDISGHPHWEATRIPGVFGDEVDMVETAVGGMTFSLWGAPSFVEFEANGICSSHRSLGIIGRTGNGDHAGAEEAGLCP